MKRAGNLYSDICSIDNIKIAYWKASKGKKHKNSTLLFRINAEANLRNLQNGLVDGTVPIGNYDYFTITDPKERIICAASFPERIIHHAIMNVCEPCFERFQIHHSYACRKGKGQHAAILQAFHCAKSSNYFLKIDIRKYFDSIDHEVLISQLRRIFKDNQLLNLFRRIIDSYHTCAGKGVPIGNLTSQYFANFYLSFLDHWVKEVLRIKNYVRYMDDMIFLENNKVNLFNAAERIVTFLRDELKLETHTPVLNTLRQGVPFLGFLIKPSGIYLLKKSKQRFEKRIKKYSRLFEADVFSENEYAQRLHSVVQHTMLARSQNFRYSCLQRVCPQALTG